MNNNNCYLQPQIYIFNMSKLKNVINIMNMEGELTVTINYTTVYCCS